MGADLPGTIRSVAYCFWTRTPQTRFALLGFFAQALELAAVGVGEGRGACQTQFDQVFIEEMLIHSVFVFVCVEVDVSEGVAVGVLGVAYACSTPRRRYGSLRSHILLRLHLGGVPQAVHQDEGNACQYIRGPGRRGPKRRTG